MVKRRYVVLFMYYSCNSVRMLYYFDSLKADMLWWFDVASGLNVAINVISKSLLPVCETESPNITLLVNKEYCG